MIPASFRFALLAGLLCLSSVASSRTQEPTTPNSAPVNAQPKLDAADQILVDLVTGPALFNDKAFKKGEYKYVRTAFSKYFETKYGSALKAAAGDDAEALFAWLEKNPKVKETLFTAIDPAAEDPGRVISVFRDLWKAGPEAVQKNDELAVAISVVWDNPQAVYDYRGHQVRTKSRSEEHTS